MILRPLQNHHLLKKGFNKLNEQHRESTAAAAALEESLTALQGEHEEFIARCQEAERRAEAADQLVQTTEARVQAAERRAGEAAVHLEQSREALQELERRIRDAEQQATDAAAIGARNVRLPPLPLSGGPPNVLFPVLDGFGGDVQM